MIDFKDNVLAIGVEFLCDSLLEFVKGHDVVCPHLEDVFRMRTVDCDQILNLAVVSEGSWSRTDISREIG